MKNSEALQTLYKYYNNLEAMETTLRINEILVWFLFVSPFQISVHLLLLVFVSVTFHASVFVVFAFYSVRIFPNISNFTFGFRSRFSIVMATKPVNGKGQNSTSRHSKTP